MAWVKWLGSRRWPCGDWRNTDTFVVARIMLEAAYRTDHDLALAWPASKMPSAKGIADRRAGAARINGSGRDASRCHNLMHHARATVHDAAAARTGH